MPPRHFLMKRTQVLKTAFKSGGGFTLIELLIAIFVLTVGIVGVLYMFPMGAQVAKSSQMTSIASQLGQAKIEEMISKSYNEISSTAEEYGEISGFKSYKRITEVSYFDPNNPETPSAEDFGIKKIETTVFWRSTFGVPEKSINLFSLVTKR